MQPGHGLQALLAVSLSAGGFAGATAGTDG